MKHQHKVSRSRHILTDSLESALLMKVSLTPSNFSRISALCKFWSTMLTHHHHHPIQSSMLTHHTPTTTTNIVMCTVFGRSAYALTIPKCTRRRQWNMDVFSEAWLPIVGGVTIITIMDLIGNWEFKYSHMIHLHHIWVRSVEGLT